ncbi:MAG: hypothetical protein MK085_11295, partial [Phycisphaerales bacterium]|nr:hypothetical protein [Phycisphaerales bacterium]
MEHGESKIPVGLLFKHEGGWITACIFRTSTNQNLSVARMIDFGPIGEGLTEEHAILPAHSTFLIRRFTILKNAFVTPEL